MNFREIMDSYCFSEYESNEYRYRLLLEKIRRHYVAPVIGPMLSSWAYPSWYDFLWRQASDTPVQDKAKELLDDGQYAECVTLLESEMGLNRFMEACLYTYHPENMEEEKRPDYQRLIPLLFPGLLFTTNIDCCLEQLYSDPFILIPVHSSTEMMDGIVQARMCSRQKRPLLVKLQGTLENPYEMVLTNYQFDKVYKRDHPFTAEIHDISKHFFPLLIGYTHDDDRSFKKVLAEFRPDGFALLEMPEDTFGYSDRGYKEIISEIDSNVIWYPHGHHECIGILLEQLAKDLGLIRDQTVMIQEEKQMADQKKQRVFIVHGHDNAAKQEMARTLESAGFEAIILHEQADTGLTIIEKIERYTDVNYAVVLYTECDLGRSKKDPIEKERNRARQNVVFEHGYLIGKLGRNHVSALVKGDVETPGDISGVVYTKMDEDGAWKMALARNMKAVGLDVDMNMFCR